jgi:hypothetical protein
MVVEFAGRVARPAIYRTVFEAFSISKSTDVDTALGAHAVPERIAPDSPLKAASGNPNAQRELTAMCAPFSP